MIFFRIALLLTVLLVLFAVYEIIGLFKKKATTYYAGDDGSYHAFGDAVFNISADCYVFHDNNQPMANRFQGSSNVENGLAQILLRNDPSSSDLTNAVHKEGWVDLAGNIYGSSGLRLGYMTDEKGKPGISGSGRWYELWLRKHSLVYTCPPLSADGGDSTLAKDRLVGKVVETGRIGSAKPNEYTVTARAGGFLLLYKDRQPKPQSEDPMAEKMTWKDTALPSTVLFTFIYGLFYLTGMGKMSFPALGEQIGFVAAMLLVFFAIWAILRQVKIESLLEGKAFDDFLMLINRNTGVGGLNNWIILFASAALLVSVFIYGSDFIPLQASMLIGAWVNKKYISGEPWKLADYEEDGSGMPDWTDGGDEEDSSGEDGEGEGEGNEGDDELAERHYVWELDSAFHQSKGELTLRFNPEKIATLRSTNPFRLTPNKGHIANVTELFELCKDNRKVHSVLRYIYSKSREKGLGELERMQFILDFVQKPNIDYEYDEKCDEIGNLFDYARYPDETMFDGRGDCDCKAVLAAVLFREAGYKTAYLTTPSHAAVAVAFKNKFSPELAEIAGQSVVTKDGYMYFFCETTGDGFKIGDLGDVTKEAVEDIIFLN